MDTTENNKRSINFGALAEHIKEFQRSDNRSNFTDAAKALIVRGLEHYRADRQNIEQARSN